MKVNREQVNFKVLWGQIIQSISILCVLENVKINVHHSINITLACLLALQHSIHFCVVHRRKKLQYVLDWLHILLMLWLASFNCLQSLTYQLLGVFACNTFKFCIWFLYWSQRIYYFNYVSIFYKLLIELSLPNYFFLKVNNVCLSLNMICCCTNLFFNIAYISLILPFNKIICTFLFHHAHLTFMSWFELLHFKVCFIYHLSKPFILFLKPFDL